MKKWNYDAEANECGTRIRPAKSMNVHGVFPITFSPRQLGIYNNTVINVISALRLHVKQFIVQSELYFKGPRHVLLGRFLSYTRYILFKNSVMFTNTVLRNFL